MTTRHTAAAFAISALLCGGFVAIDAAGQAGTPACATVATLKLPDVKISEAVAVPAATTGPIRAAHCRVNGVIGTEIRFSLLLPDTWNGKFFMGGGGGFVGSIQNSAQTTVNAGYATVGTDTGHQGGGTEASWAYNNLERQLNFGYLAVHRTAEVAKAIIAAYYARTPTRSYFQGCSRGGGQALMEAQRYPDDFDGIVAGAPAFDWTGIAATFIRNMQAAFPDPSKLTPMFTLDTLKTVESAIVAACDANDGLKDGIIDDPRQCKFNVETLPLSAVQKNALKVIYGPTTNREGEIYPGQPFGGEGQTAGWPTWITGASAPTQPGQAPSARFAFGTGVFKYFVFNNPNWDYSTYDLNNLKKDTALVATFLNATDTNLQPFKGRGGKLILWHGWADPALTPFASVKYYEQVMSRDATTPDYFRMFLMPGVLHCGGGAGPDTADWTQTIADWVEKGQAPGRVVATKVVGGAATMSRPLCPYPQKAAYNGSGNPNEAQSFTCRTR